MVESCKQLCDDQTITLADAFVISSKRTPEEALMKPWEIDSPGSRSAAFSIVTHYKGAAAAADWLLTAHLQFSELDADGKFVLIKNLFDLGQWEKALDHVNALHEDDFQQSPVLLHVGAMANLVQAIPEELRSVVLQQMPFEAGSFPLAGDATSLTHRRKAQELMRKSALATRQLACAEVANAADDYALWLELRDPELHCEGREKLKKSMREPRHSLRRLHLALQFGIELDLVEVEREIDRQTALSSGKSRDAALARFSLALTQKSPKEVAAYIDRHRAQLYDHLDRRSINLIEINMLISAGLPEEGEKRLGILMEQGLAGTEQAELRRMIAATAEADPIHRLREEFEREGHIGALVSLVQLLDERGEPSQLGHFARLLFERTKAVKDCERLARALGASSRHAELDTLLRKYPEFLKQSDNLQLFWSWCLYRNGSLAESEAELNKLRMNVDDPNRRALAVQLAIASGQWETLLPFFEQEWANREKRNAAEMIKAAQLGISLASPRVKDLVQRAVAMEPNNPNILVWAYSIATTAGWEDSEEVSLWLQRAADLSDETGPVQKGSLKELLERAPEWNRREAETWREVREGNLPIFGAADILNSSLIKLFLLPAFANPSEPDIRKQCSCARLQRVATIIDL